MRKFFIYLSVAVSLLFCFSTTGFSQVTNGNVTYYHSSTDSDSSTSESSYLESSQLKENSSTQKMNNQIIEKSLPKTNEKKYLSITVTGFVLISLVLGTSIITYRRRNK